MMPDFARSLFGFGKSATNTSQQQQYSHPTKESSMSDDSNVPTATNSRAGSVSEAHGHNRDNKNNNGAAVFAPSNPARPTTAVSTHNAHNESLSSSKMETVSSEQVNAEVRGKLKIRIIEARRLMADPSQSLPYVVCTLDSSEFITHGPSGVQLSSQQHPTGIAIPNSRQSSSIALSQMAKEQQQKINPVNPKWKDEAQFDVTSEEPILDVSIYDSANHDTFLGHVRLVPSLSERRHMDQWLPLEARVAGERVSGDVRVNISFEKASKRQYGPSDFEVLHLVGKGTFGQVFQVRKRDSGRVYAMKVLSKKAIVQKKEVAHTIGERNILVRTTASESPFIVGLKFSFQTPQDLYLVTDYMSGGELFWHLQKEGRFKEARAKFYIAELILALESLHDNDIVYRDLKPENILLDANGHIALCDFGLSKASPADGRTSTFCGTTEYLAPEVLLDDHGYTKMVDFWSLGVLVFEMCCGWSPFYAEDNQQMYKNIAFGKVRFPKDALSTEGRNFVKGLLNRNPKHRLGATDDTRELRGHEFFADVDWEQLKNKNIPPPFKPQIASETDTSNFDPEFTNTSASVLNRAFMAQGSTPLSPGIQANFQGFTYVDDSTLEDAYAKSIRDGNNRSRRRSQMYQAGDGDIDLYDDQEIAESYRNINTSELARHLERVRDQDARRQGHVDSHEDEEDHEDDDGDVRMDDDDDHDFTGQKFEL